MEANSQQVPPSIRSAMSMSRQTIKVPKSPNFSPFQTFSRLFPLSSAIPGDDLLQSLQSPQTVHSTRHPQKNPLLEAIAHSQYLPHENRRKQQWGRYKEAHADKLYENWETDECTLEDKTTLAHSYEVGSSPSKSGCSFKQSTRKVNLFRPRPIKVGVSRTIAHISPATATSQKPRSNSIPSKLWKPSKSVEFPPLSGALSTPIIHHKAKNSEIVLQPTLRLTVIDSEEFDESPAQIETVFEKIKEKKREKPVKKPLETHVRRVSLAETSSNTRYSEDTAMVLGDTSSLARRRSQLMVVPARLLRHAFVHK